MPHGANSLYPSFAYSTPQDHVGTVQMVGKTSDWNMFNTGFLQLDDHYLPQHEADFGVGITGGSIGSDPSLAKDLLHYLASSLRLVG
jgi:hypothetical protein